MTDLFDATLALADTLGILRISTATGGGTTSIVDTACTEGNDIPNGGTAWIITDAGGASAAPEGEFAKISDYASSGTTFTIGTLTAAVASGDRYGYAGGRYPLDVLISAINSALRKTRVPRWNTTSLDTVAGQSEYTLPAGIYRNNLLNVYVSTNDDSDDNGWARVNFRVQGAATGSQHTLVIISKVDTGVDIALEYLAPHAAVYAATDAIDPIIPIERITAMAAPRCELIRMRTYSSESELDIEMRKELKSEEREAEMRFPIRYPAVQGNVNEAGADV
jgi:hypothetical protein